MKILLDLFRTNPTLTVQGINARVAINSPRKVISDLREKGVPIKDRYIEEVDRFDQVHRFKEYWIDKEWFENEDLL